MGSVHAPPDPLSGQMDLPANEGGSQGKGSSVWTFLLSQLPPRGTGPVPMSFCYPTSYVGIFLAALAV